VALTVTDSFGLWDTVATTLGIYDNRPFADLAVNPNPAACGQTVTFDAGGSTHGRPDRAVVEYQWDFGDTQTLVTTAAVVTHSYTAFGSYTATVTVVDDNTPAETDTASQLIEVSLGNTAPIADAGGPYWIDTGDGLLLDGSGSSDPDAACGDGIVSYEWSYEWDLDNDGEFDYTGPTVSVPWADISGLPQPGVVNPITLRVSDAFGATARPRPRPSCRSSSTGRRPDLPSTRIRPAVGRS